MLGETAWLELGDLPPEIVEGVPEPARLAVGAAPAASPGGFEPVIPEPTWEDHEKAKIQEALQRTNWNITRAAQLLGMTFRTLQYRLEKFGLRRP